MSRTITPQDLAEAEALIGGGMSATAAAKHLGFSESGLRGARKKRVRYEGWDYKSAPDPSDPLTADEIPVIHRDYSHLSELFVYPLGDVHLGAAGHARSKWAQWLSYLESREDVSMIGTGDFLNSALKDSKSDSYLETMTVGDARKLLRTQLEPVKDKIDVLVPGNHEGRIHRAIGDCPIDVVAELLGVPYARECALLVYDVGEVRYLGYLRHGTGGGGTPGAQANQMARNGNVVLADFYVTGHTHKQMAFPEEMFVFNDDTFRVERRQKYFVGSGSFVGYEGYAAERGYPPTKIGAPRIFLSGDHRDVHASV